MNAVDLLVCIFFYESWFVFDLFFVFVIDAMPPKKKKTLLDKEWHFWTVF